MKALAFVALLGTAALAAPASAQITFDMSRVVCADYNAMDPASSRTFSAWMSGWFAQRSGSTRINLEGHRRNVASVRSWCASNPRQLIMNGLMSAAANARPGTPGPTTIDASQVTCGQLGAANPELKALVVPWMGGWFMSTKNLTSVDIRYVRRNASVISSYCRGNRNTKLMDVLETNWR